MSYANVSGIVVAGGRSRRLGHDKRRLRLWGAQGPTLLEHTLDVLARLCTDLVVVLNDPQDWITLPARIVLDVYPNAGVLGGIYSGLCAIAQTHALVVAADMPLLNNNLLHTMLMYPRLYEVLVPRSFQHPNICNRAGLEPLHAIYSCRCLDQLQFALEQGTLRVTDFLSTCRCQVLEPDVIRKDDPHGYSFLNINTPEDLAFVQSLIRTQQIGTHPSL